MNIGKKYMHKQLIQLSALTGILILLTGCVMEPKPFIPKALDDNARGITTVNSPPYGCKFLGEIEGHDGAPPKPFQQDASTMSAARKGALNDVRNQAVDVTGSRIVLSIAREQAICFDGADCSHLKNQDIFVSSYVVTAQIFECGDKDK